MAAKKRGRPAANAGRDAGARVGAARTITIPLDGIAERAARLLPGADATRLQSLQGLQFLRNARNVGDQRAVEQLRKRFGKDQPQVAALERRIAANELLVRNLGAEADRAATPPVQAAAGTYVVHGRVRDTSLAGVPKYVVELAQTQGARDRGTRSEPTDDTGYFKITVLGVKDPGAEADAPAAVGEVANEAKPAAVPRRRAVVVKDASVYLRVLRGGAVVKEDGRPLTPRSGAVDYVEVVVSVGQ
jgi:hypothetical protein